jgi:hypothetical protein
LQRKLGRHFARRLGRNSHGTDGIPSECNRDRFRGAAHTLKRHIYCHSCLRYRPPADLIGNVMIMLGDTAEAVARGQLGRAGWPQVSELLITTWRGHRACGHNLGEYAEKAVAAHCGCLSGANAVPGAPGPDGPPPPCR